MSTYAELQDQFHRSLFIVIGYMHENDKRDFLSDLIKVIALFYDRSDTFDAEYKGRGMRIVDSSNGKRVLKIEKSSHQCIFGTEIISKGKFSWKLRVKSMYYQQNYWHIYVGVMNLDKIVRHQSFIANTHPERKGCYTFDTTLGRVANESNTMKTFKRKVTKAGDIMDVTLDLDNKIVSCKVNDEDIGVSIKDIETGKYRLVVSLYFDKTEIEIL